MEATGTTLADVLVHLDSRYPGEEESGTLYLVLKTVIDVLDETRRQTQELRTDD